MTDIRLVDLDVIKRFSLALRCEAAPASDVLAALDASREAVLAAVAREAEQEQAQARPKKRRPARPLVAGGHATPAAARVATRAVASAAAGGGKGSGRR